MAVEPREVTDRARSEWRPKATLPGDAYHRPEVWEREKELIFQAAWYCVGREEEIAEPGDFMVRDVAGEGVLLARAKDEKLRAFYNVCRHRGTRLCDGEGHAKSNVFVCPYHAWTYDTAGNLLGTPNVHEDEGFDRSSNSLWQMAVEVQDGFIYVNMSSDPETLSDFLSRNPEGDPAEHTRWGLDELRLGHRIDYEVAANWKIILENYNECLHCPSIHPELVSLVPLFKKGLVEGERGAELVHGAQTLSMDGTTNRPPFPSLEPEDCRVYFGMTVFPTFMINYQPDYVMTYRLEPRDPLNTLVVSEFLFRPEVVESADFDPSGVVDFWDLVSRQDWSVCERAQKGVRSRAFSKGGVFPFNDRWVHEFNRRYRESMDEG
ncbi:MAG: aromatic ring-hydroxylating dioxygenase subunit alpha [Actinomycetota bacterium]